MNSSPPPVALLRPSFWRDALFLRALYARSLYRALQTSGKGWGITYLMLLIAIALLPASFRINDMAEKLHTELLDEQGMLILPASVESMLQQIPTMQLQNGTLFLEQTEPLLFTHPEYNISLLAIDTKNQLRLPNPDPALLTLRKEEIWVWNNTEQPRAISLDYLSQALKLTPEETLTIDQAQITLWLEELAHSLPAVPVLFYAWQWVQIFLDLLLRILFMAWIGQLMLPLYRVPVEPFSVMMRFSAYASTPIVLSQAISLLLGTPLFVFAQPVYFVMHVLYMIFAIESIRPRTQKT